MTIDILIVFIVLAGAVVLFSMEKFPVDLTAIVVMTALLLTGIITPEEGISGFSNSATVTVAAMFVLSAGLFNTGAMNLITEMLRKLMKKNYKLGILALMIAACFISAFINNTAVVALFIPIVISIARASKISPSKMLMPLSFSAILGGVCTLIGTSTNILTSAILQQNGAPPLGMFEMSSFGVTLSVVGIFYMMFIGIKLLPEKKANELTENFEMLDYITEIILPADSKYINNSIRDSSLVKEIDIDILEIQRSDGRKFIPSPDSLLLENDTLKVRCNIEKLKEISQKEGVILKPERKFAEEDLLFNEAKMVEAVITPNSRLIGKTIKSISFRNSFGATVLAIRHRGKIMHEKLANTVLLAGDVLLIEVKRDWLPQLRKNTAFILISEVTLTKMKKSKIIISILILSAVVLAAAFNLMPIVGTAIIGSVLLILTGCVSLEEAYKAVDWKVIFLLAGLVTLGIALQKSGGAEYISNGIIHLASSSNPHVLVSLFFFLSMALTAFMSNNASVALLIPISLVTANTLSIDSRPLIMAVTFAASIDFMTPIGYQTNTMIYGPGNYKFTDYLKVGAPLNFICWLLGSLLIPVIF